MSFVLLFVIVVIRALICYRRCPYRDRSSFVPYLYPYQYRSRRGRAHTSGTPTPTTHRHRGCVRAHAHAGLSALWEYPANRQPVRRAEQGDAELGPRAELADLEAPEDARGGQARNGRKGAGRLRTRSACSAAHACAAAGQRSMHTGESIGGHAAAQSRSVWPTGRRSAHARRTTRLP